MWYAASPTRYQSSLMGGPQYERVRSEASERWILAHAWQMDVGHVDEWCLSDRPDASYVVRVNQADTPLRLADTFEGLPIDLVSAERVMMQSRVESAAGR
jgi:hypothetical protein